VAAVHLHARPTLGGDAQQARRGRDDAIERGGIVMSYSLYIGFRSRFEQGLSQTLGI
jgi:hypothetical protein